MNSSRLSETIKIIHSIATSIHSRIRNNPSRYPSTGQKYYKSVSNVSKSVSLILISRCGFEQIQSENLERFSSEWISESWFKLE